MDVAGEPKGAMPALAAPATPRAGVHSLAPARVAEALERCQRRELRIARGFAECRGLSREQLEDLYQETVLALLRRPYQDEKHLRDALRTGIKRRALNLYRDDARRREILVESAGAIHAAEQARSAEADPAHAVLARQDRLLIAEFMAGLTLRERRVFWLLTEGMKYNRIAKVTGLPVNDARNTVASCERKRERFQVLYDSGRLCGYRAHTIKKLLDGQTTSDELAQLAVAHVEACAHCRADYKTNASRLRRAFEEHAAALLPPTVRLGRLSRVSVHARALAARVRPDWLSVGQDGARERAAALVAGGGASAKLAAGIVTVAAIAGAGLTATHTLIGPHQPPHADHRRSATAVTLAPAAQPVELARLSLSLAIGAADPHAPRRKPAPHRGAPGHVAAIPRQPANTVTPSRDEPGGFAYLGVPTTPTPPPAPAEQTAQTAAHTGGPFSP